MALGQEDLGVLMRILAENIGEGSKAAAVEGTKASTKGIRRFIVCYLRAPVNSCFLSQMKLLQMKD